MSILTKRIAATLFPRYSRSLDLVNANARMQRWIEAIPASVPRVPDRAAVDDYLAAHVIKGSAIDYLEFGVYRGDSMRAWTGRSPNPASRFFGFDSFEGLPEHWTGKFGAGAFDTGGQIPQIADDRVSFVKGWFQHTLPGFLDDFTPMNRLVVNNDSDLYSSSMFVLAKLDRLMVPGTILVFDEFTSPLHEFRAFEDYLSAFMRAARPLVMTGLGPGHGAADRIAFEIQ